MNRKPVLTPPASSHQLKSDAGETADHPLGAADKKPKRVHSRKFWFRVEGLGSRILG